MPLQQRTSTTRLPAALREQIDQETNQSTRKRQNPVVNRKQARKQERQQQKQRKADFFFRNKPLDTQPNHKRSAEDPEQDEPVKKKPRRAPVSTVSQQANADEQNASSSASTSRVQRPPKESSFRAISGLKSTSKDSSHKPSRTNVKVQPSHEEDAEDVRIAWLEAKLGMGKQSRSGKKMSTLFGDGLDDLMDGIDRIIPMDAPTLVNPSESDDQEGSEPSEFEGFSAAEEDAEEDNTDTRQTDSEEAGEERASGVIRPDNIITTALSEEADQTSAQPGSRYIPPHLRQRPTDESEALLKLSRQMKGLLNRLSEQNMASIIVSIEDLYRKHRRHDITTTLTDLTINGISSHSSHLDSFVVLYASLVASLHKIIGVDFAAHFIQSLVSSYEQNYLILRGNDLPNATGDDTKGKECLNLAVLLSELYNFQVISCVLVYDVIRGLLDTLDEFDVELLLKIARNSGQQLRQDDPSALKDIIQMVQAKMAQKEQATISSRTQFMIETLTNLKNNKVKRIAGQDGHAESVERMKKFLSGLSKKHHVMAHEPLRVSLDDLHSSEKKGKWWLVGSAWGGDPLLDRAHADDRQTASKNASTLAADSLLKLARKQGMNTDVRRSIFVVLMSSDDYVDACERLSQLNLTEVQQREIVRVILHCLGNEKQYNPYYTLVVQQLCRTSHSYKVTLQFCLWDFLRDLGEKSVGGAEIIKSLDDDAHIPFDAKKISSTRRLNVARAYAWWIAKGCSSLTILKPVDFTALQTQSRDFLRVLFWQLFVSSQVSSPVIAPNAEAAEYLSGARIRESLEEVFIKATRVPTLTQGLIYFLTTALRGDDGSNNEVVSGTLKWAREVAKDTLRTGMDVVASLT